jgi:hypothetical protein
MGRSEINNYNEDINYDIESKFKTKKKTLKEILNSKIYKNEDHD